MSSQYNKHVSYLHFSEEKTVKLREAQWPVHDSSLSLKLDSKHFDSKRVLFLPYYSPHSVGILSSGSLIPHKHVMVVKHTILQMVVFCVGYSGSLRWSHSFPSHFLFVCFPPWAQREATHFGHSTQEINISVFPLHSFYVFVYIRTGITSSLKMIPIIWLDPKVWVLKRIFKNI